MKLHPRVLGAGVAAIVAAALPGSSAAAAPDGPGADAVVRWNRILLGILRTPGAQPPRSTRTRSFAMMHAAIATTRSMRSSRPRHYLVHLARRARVRPPRPPGGARRARPALPRRRPALDAQEHARSSRRSRTAGARTAASQRRRRRRRRRARAARPTTARRDAAAVHVPGAPGDYQPTPPAFAAPVFTHWGAVRRSSCDAADAVPARRRRRRSPAAPTPTAFDEVQSLGRRQHDAHRRPDRRSRASGRRRSRTTGTRSPQTRGAGRTTRPRGRRAAVRAAQPDARRLHDRVLRRQVRLPTLAADHRDPRQPTRDGNPRPSPIRPGRRSRPRRPIRPIRARTASSAARRPRS